MSEDIVEKYWLKWLNANELKQFDIIKLLVEKRIISPIKDKKLKIHSMSTLLNSYFEDLAVVVKLATIKECKKELEEAFLDVVFDFNIRICSKEVWNEFWKELLGASE